MTAADQERLGAAIRAARLRLKLLQAELGARACVDQSYISKIERGLRPMNLDTLRRIAAALETTPAKLLGDT